MSRIHLWRTRVRSYELDAYGHVNNAVYVQWLEQARCAMLMDEGFDYYDIERRWGVRYVTVAVHVDYEAGLHLDQPVVVRTSITRTGRSSFGLLQEIFREEPEEQRAAKAAVTIVFTDPEMKQSVPLPEEFVRLFVEDLRSD